MGFGRVFLVHHDIFGELTVRHEGMLQLETRRFWARTRRCRPNFEPKSCLGDSHEPEEYVEPLDLFEVDPKEALDTSHKELRRP